MNTSTPNKKIPDTTSESLPTFRRLGRGTLVLGRKARRPLLYLLVFGIIAYCGFNVYATVLLNRELAELRASGAPMTYAELAPPPMAASQDAAPFYEQAAASLKHTEEKSPEYQKQKSSSAKFEVLANENPQALPLLRQAAQRPYYNTPVDWTVSPIQITLPHLQQMRDFSHFLAARAVLDARAGKVDAALDNIRIMHVLASHLKDEPIIITYLVAMGISQRADAALDEVLKLHPISAQRAQAFQASLPAIDWPAMFQRALQGERCFSLWAYENARNSSQLFASPDPLESWYFKKPLNILWTPIFKMDQVQGLRLWKRYMAQPSLTNTLLPTGKLAAQQLAPEIPSYAVLTRLLFPTFYGARWRLDKQRVLDNQREVALALSAYKARSGNYPVHLQLAQKSWGKALPQDPYNNKSFGYQRTPEGFLLYSVGQNRKDEGGRQGDRRMNGDTDDILWGRE